MAIHTSRMVEDSHGKQLLQFLTQSVHQAVHIKHKPTHWNRKLAKGKTYTVIPKQGLNLRKGKLYKAPVIKTEPCGTKLYYYGGYAYNGKEAWVWVTDERMKDSSRGDANYLKGYIA